MMERIGNMLWRIGDILDFDQQLAWTRRAGFGGIGFHASPGVPGQWAGIEPSTCGTTERTRLRRLLGDFSFAEIHAPFAIELRTDALPQGIAALMPVLRLARDLGVGLVTVHAQLPQIDRDAERRAWTLPMQELSRQAAQMQTRVALEISAGFDLVMDWGLANLGVNLDVGHMYLPANRDALCDMGGIGDLIRRIGDSLVHLHLHDVDGATDHIQIGTGVVAWDEVASALEDIHYSGGAMLEMNPDRVTPQGIVSSAEYISRRFCLARRR